jgi:hypothetical protein
MYFRGCVRRTDGTALGQVSAACYYFAEGLLDLQAAEGGAVAPIGIVNTAIGGTMICDWTDNATTATVRAAQGV